jgi:tetraacyldisaccharide 4'-kinase
LQDLGLSPNRTHVFRDHHAYQPGDFEGLAGVVLMTEKDAVKCRDFAAPGGPLADAWYLRVEARLPADWETSLVARVQELVGQTEHRVEHRLQHAAEHRVEHRTENRDGEA